MNTLISGNPQEAAAGAFILGGLFAGVIIVSIIVSIMLVIAGWKIFKKAGEPGWKILIPFCNIYVYLKILNLKNWFWFMLALDVLLLVSCIACKFDLYLVMTGDANQVEAYLNSYDFGANPMVIISFVLFTVYSIILSILSAYRLSKVFGHGIGFTIGNLFLPEIFWLILGFGKSKYNKKRLNA